MNLAKTLSIILWLACACAPAVGIPGHRSATDQLSASQTADNSGTTQQQPSSPGQPAAATAPQDASKQAPQPSSKTTTHKHKKSTKASNCANPTPAGSDAANAATAKPAANCPPPKTVVRNGGTSEPSIQLSGGAAQAQQRSTTDQLLGSTEENLKKIAGRQLTPAQQDMVSQIHQYMEQSKEAVTSGDADRGRMLAQKAQLLSDELAKP